MIANLHMLQLEFRPEVLMRWTAGHGIDAADEGYAVHHALRAAFGAQAPQPFAVTSGTHGAAWKVLGYGAANKDSLRQTLRFTAEPLLEELFPSEAILSKLMPDRFPTGMRLGFEVRLCPVVRQSEGPRGKPREVDLFLAHAHRPDAGSNLSRELIYAEWLAERLRRGGAEPLRCTDATRAGEAERPDLAMTRYQEVPLVRRRHPRRGSGGQAGQPRRLLRHEDGKMVAARRPDVTFRGTLRVADPERFHDLLARGVGRHRAFGFGMLLLRRAA